MTCSKGTKPAPSGSATQRGRLSGTLMRTKRGRPRLPTDTRTARLMLPLEMNGKGCSASTASGVRMGWTLSTKWRRSNWRSPSETSA